MASNVVTTTGTTRSNMGADTVLDGYLKDKYLPRLTDTIYFSTPLTRLIADRMGKYDMTGRRLVAAFSTQRSAGVGPIAEGGDFVRSVPVDGVQGTCSLKYMNLYFELSGPTVETVKAGDGSYVDAVSAHLSSIMKAAQMDYERILCGQGDGVLAKVVSVDQASSTITVSGPGFFDTQFLEKGMWIEVHQSGAFGTERTVDDGAEITAMRITALTPGNKRTGTNGTITVVDANGDGIDAGHAIVAGDWITRENAYTGTTSLTPDGLMNLISDGASTTSTYLGAETSTNFTTIWGLDRTDAATAFLASQVYNVNAELDEDVLLTVLLENKTQYRGRPNLLLISPRAMIKYFQNSRDDRRYNTMDAMEWTNGYKGAGIQLGDTKLMLTTAETCPANYGFLLNVENLARIRPPGMNGFKWRTSEGGSVLRQKEGSDNVFATAVDYFNHIDNDPGSQCKMYGITEN